jgi:hypothetical protein
MHVREPRQPAAGREIPVRGVDDQLHGRRHRFVREAFAGTGGRGPRAGLRFEPALEQAIDEREHRPERIARRTDAV